MIPYPTIGTRELKCSVGGSRQAIRPFQCASTRSCQAIVCYACGLSSNNGEDMDAGQMVAPRWTGCHERIATSAEKPRDENGTHQYMPERRFEPRYLPTVSWVQLFVVVEPVHWPFVLLSFLLLFSSSSCSLLSASFKRGWEETVGQ